MLSKVLEIAVFSLVLPILIFHLDMAFFLHFFGVFKKTSILFIGTLFKISTDISSCQIIINSVLMDIVNKIKIEQAEALMLV